jgi:hypothetical protein
MPKPQVKPSVLKREHPALQNMKILYFFLFLWVIFALLNADPDPDPATQINADPDPDPQPWIFLALHVGADHLYSLSFVGYPFAVPCISRG